MIMRKIMIFANDESTILNFRQEIVKAFVDAKYRVVVCYPLGNNTRVIQNLGCEVIDVDVSRHGKSILQDMRFERTCKNLIRKHKPDVVLTYTIKPNIYTSIACQQTKTPYINNITGLGTVLQNKSVLSILLLQLQRFAYRKSSCVFFQNQANLETMKKAGVISDKISTKIIPGSGVNLDKQKFEPFPKDEGVTKFVIVSRIREDKGYKEFFEAAEKVKKEYPYTEFHVVGWYEDDSLRQIVDSLNDRGIIIYHGEKTQKEVHEIESKCNCLIHPSYHEGMANVLLEAAATGRPVIASNIHGCIEAFDDGITGYSCEVKNAHSLEKAIIKMINTSYENQVEMGKLGRLKMEKEFDRQFVACEYINTINKILEDK